MAKSPWKLPMSMRSSSSGHGTERTAPPRPAASWVSRAISASVSESWWPRLRISPAASELRGSQQQGVDDVVDVQAIAPLRAVAVQHDLVTQQGLADEHREEAEALALEVLTGAVDVGQPQHGRAEGVQLPIEQVELLARQLVDAIDVDRCRRVLLVDREIAGPAIHLARRRLDDHRVRCRLPQGLEERDVTAYVQVEIAHGLLHRREVADLPGDVEHDVGAVYGVGDLLGPDVGNDHLDVGVGSDAHQVVPLSAVFGDQGVDDDHRRPDRSEAVHDGGTDESETAGDDTSCAGEAGARMVRLADAGLVWRTHSWRTLCWTGGRRRAGSREGSARPGRWATAPGVAADAVVG